MILLYFVILSSTIFAIGISGVVASRNFLIMMLSIEIALTGSTLLALSLFYYVSASNIVIFLLVIWAIASTEVMALVVFYKYMVKGSISLDVRKLSKLKN